MKHFPLCNGFTPFSIRRIDFTFFRRGFLLFPLLLRVFLISRKKRDINHKFRFAVHKISRTQSVVLEGVKFVARVALSSSSTIEKIISSILAFVEGSYEWFPRL